MKATIKKTFSLILCLALGLGLSIGLSYVHATGTWSDPATNPPDCTVTSGTAVPPNCDASQPVNVGPVAQVKGINTLGGLGVNEFVAAQNAQLDAVSMFRGLVLGLVSTTDPDDSTLAIGDTSSTAHLSITGKQYTEEGGLYSDRTIAPSGELKPVCSDKDGNVIICSDPPPPPPPPTSGVISGKLAYFCTDFKSGRDLHAGTGHIYIYFDNPTPVALTMKFADCLDNPQINSSGYADTCSGVSLIPGGTPSGYIDDGSLTRTMTIPSGSSFYATPYQWADDRVLQPGWAPSILGCDNNGKRRNTQVSKMAHAYLKIQSPSTGWTLNLSGTSYQPNFTSPVTFPVTQI